MKSRLRAPNVWEISSCQFYLLTEFLPEICWEAAAKEIFFYITFYGRVWNMISHLSQYTNY